MAVSILNIDKKLYQLKELRKERPDGFDLFLKKLLISWLYHDNALEGIVLQDREIEVALTEDEPIGDASQILLYKDIRNHRKVIDLIYEESNKERLHISIDFIKKLHNIMMVAHTDIHPGKYRVDIPLHRAYFHEICPPQRISYYMTKLVQSLSQKQIKALHPIYAVSRLHFQFMYIYPFSEGSGKIARILMNLILLQNGYMPTIIHAVDRQRYYMALKTGEEELTKIILLALNNSLDSALKFLENLPPMSASAS